MKKLLNLALVAALLVLATACGTGAATTEKDIPEAPDIAKDEQAQPDVVQDTTLPTPKLKVLSVSPNSGTTAGGYLAVLNGSGFTAGSRVFFGEGEAQDVQVQSLFLITCKVPPGDVGKVDVKVLRLDEESDVLEGGFSYKEGTAQDPLSLSGVVPESGPDKGGYLCLLSGNGFGAGMTVRLGPYAAESVNVISATSVSFIAPKGLPGKVDVVVKLGDQTAVLEQGFEYLPSDVTEILKVSGVYPVTGDLDGGYLAVVTGTGFADGLAVSFGAGTASVVDVPSTTSATVMVPPGAAPGKVDVTATLGDQTAILAAGFEYIDGSVAVPLSVLSVQPSSGPADGGYPAVVVGTGFKPGLTLLLGNVAADFVNVVSGDVLTFLVPPGEPGTVTLKIVQGDSSATLENAFTYLAVDALSVTGIDPASGPVSGGTVCLVKGTAFSATTSVYFGAVKALVKDVVSDQALLVETPPATVPGKVDVVVQDGLGISATLTAAFDYTEQEVLKLAKVQPSSGYVTGGYLAMLTGAGFEDGLQVSFGGLSAGYVSVLSSAAAVAEVPASDVPGTVDVTVENVDGVTAVLVQGFQYLEEDEITSDPPQVGLVKPKKGPVAGGTWVFVSGTNLSPSATVHFEDVLAASVSNIDSKSLLALTPPMPPGYADVKVTNPDGQHSTLSNAFQFQVSAGPAPAITQLLPSSGPSTGGTLVLVTGTGFQAGLAIYLGYLPVSALKVLSSTQATFVTPASEVGPADLALVNPDGQTAFLPDAFSYYEVGPGLPPPPVPGSVFPKYGSTKGGETVTVTGTGFEEDSLVYIDGEPVEVLAVVGTSQIKVKTNPHAAGSVDVAVVNADGQTGLLEGGFIYLVEPPFIGAVVPDSGLVSGGTNVVIQGKNFAAGAKVLWGGQPLGGLIVLPPDQITVVAPAHAAGSVSVTVTNPDGLSDTRIDGYTYKEPEQVKPPTVAKVSPAHGAAAGGYDVVVTGESFDAACLVKFGTKTSGKVLFLSSQALVVKVPSGTAGETVAVEVANPDGQSGSLADGFTWDSEEIAQLNLLSVTPSSGPQAGGTPVTIVGAGFSSQGLKVFFGAKEATGVSLVSDQVLSAATPAGLPGLVDVKVQSAGQEAVLTGAFLYQAPPQQTPPPVLSQVIPPTGPSAGGTLVELHGSGFGKGAQVMFGGVISGKVTFSSESLLLAVSPAHAGGTVSVVVFNPDGQSSILGNGFTYYEETAAKSPVVLSVVPTFGSALGGEAVTVAGQNFSTGLTLFFCGLPATNVQVFGGTQASAKTPAAPVGICDVSVVNPDGQSSTLQDAFTFQAPKPSLAQVVPSQGDTKGGTSVVLSGSSFMQGMEVWFGVSKATPVTVFDEATASAVTPAGLPGPVDVKVVNPGGQQGLLPGGFTYKEGAQTLPPPKVTSLVPASGPVGGNTVVSVTGTDFQDGISVVFGQSKATQVTWNGPKSLLVITPPGNEGPVDVTFLNPDGQGITVPNAFVYVVPTKPAPQVFGAVPSSGPEKGGTTILVTGKNFSSKGMLYIGYQPVGQFTFLNTSVVSGTTPAGKPGPVTVSYVADDGQEASLANGFTYIPAPSVGSISPELGPVAGGTDVTIVGQNFQPGLTVWFGAVEAVGAAVENSLIVHATAPKAALAGVVDIKVVNPDGQSGLLPKAFTYLKAPKLDKVAPSSGPVTGGTPVAVSGTGFFAGAEVLFGSTPALKMQLVSDTLILCEAPAAAAPGTVSVKVVNPDQQSSTLPDSFIYLPEGGVPPTITSLTPASGPETGDTLVTLAGTELGTPDTLLLGQTPVTTFVSASNTEIVFKTPPHAPGVVDVVYVNKAGLSAVATKAFTFIAGGQLDPAPKIVSIDPTSGPTAGGTSVTLAGTGFKNNATVFFGTVKAVSVQFQSPGSVTAVTAPQGAGVVDVTILNPDGQLGVLKQSYTLVPPPSVTSVAPGDGASAGGTEVTIVGTGFWAGDTPSKRSKIVLCDDFAGQKGCVTLLDNKVASLTTTKIVFETPAHAPGFVDVGVLNPDGQKGFLGKAFYFNEPPVITQISPTSGSTVGGQTVVVTGTGFQAGVEVYFASKIAPSITLNGADKITVKTPPGTHGKADVTVLNPDGSEVVLTLGYEYISPPIITKVYPLSGPEDGGTDVTVEGNYFWTSNPGSRVWFGNVQVALGDTNVISNKVIQVKSPPGKGPTAIKVSNPDGQEATLADAFVYVPPAPPPTITFVVPSYGLATGGYPVSIIGTGFQDGAQVYFGKPGDWTAGVGAQVKNIGTMITVTAPAHAAGKVDVRVVNTNQQEVNLVNGFEFTPAPQLPPLAFSSVNPNRGPVAGGITVTVSGKGFKPGIQVYVGIAPDWTEADSVNHLGPTLLHVTMPPSPTGNSGTFDLLLLNPSDPGNPDQVIAKGAFAYTKGGVLVRRGLRLPPDGRDDYVGDLVDLNNDGLEDAVIWPTNGWNKQAQVFLNTDDPDNGPGTYIYQTTLTNWNNSDGRSAYGDFDGDGDLDIVQKRSDRMSLEYNNGDGTFGGANDKGYISSEANYLTVADFDCDGYLDVFVAVDSTSTSRPNRILTNDGYSNFDDNSTSVLPAHYEYTRQGAAADVDLDGDVDLVLANRVAMQKRLYYNNCANIDQPPKCARPLCQTETYNGHSYAICGDGRTWENAKKRCEHFGYYLAVINDAAENAFLMSKTTGGEYWIGLNDLDVEGQWKWSNGATASPQWCGGQPDNSGNVEDCASFRFNGNSCWGDRNCASGYRFICEADVKFCPAWKFTDALYGPGQNFPIAGFDTQWVTMVDLDNNGFPDAIAGNWGQQTKVYMNYSGNFLNDDLAHYPQNETEVYVYKMFAADLDLDGDTDLVSMVKDGDWVWMRVYKNDRNNGGSGALSYDKNAVPLRRTDTSEIMVGDIDGDSLPDIYVVNRSHQDQILINNGFAEGKPWVDANRVGQGKFAFNTVEGYPEDFGDARDVRAADIDKDGDLDLVQLGWGWTRVRILLNDGAGNFVDESAARMPVLKYPVYSDGQSLALADLDNDGDTDVVVAGYEDYYWNNGASQIRELLNDGTGFFKDSTQGNVPATTDNGFRGLCIADFNKDGKKDIFADGFSTWADNRFMRLLINGGDPFATGDVYFFDQTSAYFGGMTFDGMSAVAARDFNNDGYPDIYMGRGWGNYQNRVLLNQAGKTFVDVTGTYLPSVSDDTKQVHIEDLDLDGDYDLLSTNWGQNRIYLQEKDYKFADATTSNLPTESYQSLDACIADFDEDGLPDIYTVNYDQKNSLYFNVGAGKFQSKPDNIPWDQDYSRSCAAADFDGDGDIDVFVSNVGLDAYYENTNN